ncbi:MAG: hypothetical protein ACYDHT_11585 [Solirubrobacteraceae bacterium]
MLASRRLLKALPLCCLLALALAPLAHAAAPATVTVHVEGASSTLLAPTTVTTTTAPVEKDGNSAHTCTGTSAAGALEQATSGSWGGSWFSGLGYSAETILGETHSFDPEAAANFFWSFWLNNAPSTQGICEAELTTGASILFFPDCFSETGACPPPPNPLGIAAPAVADAGAPIGVTVTSYANATGAPSPAVGATVTGGGASASTDASGHATLALSQTGNVQLRVTAPASVPSEATVCVHKGNDGNCGSVASTTPSSSGVLGSTTTSAAAYKGPYAVVATATGVVDSHVYTPATAPRLLHGTAVAHTRIASVSLRLRRSYHHHCWAYNGISERFVRTRCGGGSFFKVASTPSFSYLLPGALKRGRYVLDIEATDAAGNRTSLARGSSRLVFYVR